MAWDTEGTKRRLLEAAKAEFAERGPDGATMAGIAERAGINKERLYRYFGDKHALFETVLSAELERLAAAVGPFPDRLEDIGDYAGRSYDYHAENPQLVRLLLWEALAGGPAADEANRTVHYRHKVEAYSRLRGSGALDDDLDPADLVFLIIGVASWWYAVPQLVRMLTGTDSPDPEEHARRRASVVSAAERLATPLRRPAG